MVLWLYFHKGSLVSVLQPGVQNRVKSSVVNDEYPLQLLHLWPHFVTSFKTSIPEHNGCHFPEDILQVHMVLTNSY